MSAALPASRRSRSPTRRSMRSSFGHDHLGLPPIGNETYHDAVVARRHARYAGDHPLRHAAADVHRESRIDSTIVEDRHGAARRADRSSTRLHRPTRSGDDRGLQRRHDGDGHGRRRCSRRCSAPNRLIGSKTFAPESLSGHAAHSDLHGHRARSGEERARVSALDFGSSARRAVDLRFGTSPVAIAGHAANQGVARHGGARGERRRRCRRRRAIKLSSPGRWRTTRSFSKAARRRRPTHAGVGGVPSRRMFLRFNVPSHIVDSTTVVRASLLLTQVPNRRRRRRTIRSTSTRWRFSRGPAVTDVASALQFLGTNGQFGLDSLLLAPGDSGLRSFEIVGLVRTWKGQADDRQPANHCASQRRRRALPGEIDFFSTRAALAASTEAPNYLRPADELRDAMMMRQDHSTRPRWASACPLLVWCRRSRPARGRARNRTQHTRIRFSDAASSARAPRVPAARLARWIRFARSIRRRIALTRHAHCVLPDGAGVPHVYDVRRARSDTTTARYPVRVRRAADWRQRRVMSLRRRRRCSTARRRRSFNTTQVLNGGRQRADDHDVSASTARSMMFVSRRLGHPASWLRLGVGAARHYRTATSITRHAVVRRFGRSSRRSRSSASWASAAPRCRSEFAHRRPGSSLVRVRRVRGGESAASSSRTRCWPRRTCRTSSARRSRTRAFRTRRSPCERRTRLVVARLARHARICMASTRGTRASGPTCAGPRIGDRIIVLTRWLPRPDAAVPSRDAHGDREEFFGRRWNGIRQRPGSHRSCADPRVANVPTFRHPSTRGRSASGSPSGREPCRGQAPRRPPTRH